MVWFISNLNPLNPIKDKIVCIILTEDDIKFLQISLKIIET